MARAWTEADAYAFCARLAKAHYENFPVGSMLVPAGLRPDVHALYAFMRTADDFADERRSPGDEAERLAWMAAWSGWLDDCLDGRARHPIFVALRATLHRRALPPEWLRDLLSAFTQDITQRRYADWEALKDYCRRSANPVGRLVLALFGYRDPERQRRSDAICTALQLANHWQDVAVDLKKDRVYLPQDEMARFRVTETDLRGERGSREFQSLMAFETGRARALFYEGQPLPETVSGRLRFELRATWLGGMRILDKLEAGNFDVFHRRPVVTRLDWAAIAARALTGL